MGMLSYQNAEQARKEIVRTWRQKLFGLSRRDVWNALAGEIGARIEKGGWIEGDQVVLDVSPCWQIMLDIHQADKMVFTRMRCPFVNLEQFRFKVYRKSIFSNLGKKLGMQDIEVGDPFFDDAFVVKSNKPDRVRQLLRNKRIRKLIQAQPRLWFSLLDDEGWFGTKFPKYVDELKFEVNGVIKDLDLLKNLFILFVETLEELHRMGMVKESNAGVKL